MAIAQCTVEVECDRCDETAVAIFDRLPMESELLAFLKRDGWVLRPTAYQKDWLCEDCAADDDEPDDD